MPVHPHRWVGNGSLKVGDGYTSGPKERERLC